MKILFVCLGNICRSPMAEAVLRDKIKKNPKFSGILVDSAGTAGYHIGEKPHKGTRKILKYHQIDDDGIVGRKVSNEDFEIFDIIVAMDENNYADLKSMAVGREAQNKIRLLSDFVDNPSWKSVPDPWYTDNFDETYQLVSRGCDGILQFLTHDN